MFCTVHMRMYDVVMTHVQPPLLERFHSIYIFAQVDIFLHILNETHALKQLVTSKPASDQKKRPANTITTNRSPTQILW